MKSIPDPPLVTTKHDRIAAQLATWEARVDRWQTRLGDATDADERMLVICALATAMQTANRLARDLAAAEDV